MGLERQFHHLSREADERVTVYYSLGEWWMSTLGKWSYSFRRSKTYCNELPYRFGRPGSVGLSGHYEGVLEDRNSIGYPSRWDITGILAHLSCTVNKVSGGNGALPYLTVWGQNVGIPVRLGFASQGHIISFSGPHVVDGLLTSLVLVLYHEQKA